MTYITLATISITALLILGFACAFAWGFYAIKEKFANKNPRSTLNDKYNQAGQMATYKEDDETEKFGQFLDGMSAEDFEELEDVIND